MRRGLFWKLFLILVGGAITLFTAIHWLLNHTEERMSQIAPEHREELRAYAKTAQDFYLKGQHKALNNWLNELREKEDTWVGIVNSSLELVAGTRIDDTYLNAFKLGRDVEWKIHLYFDYNPIMELPFVDASTHFLIRLPDRMRPGDLWKPTKLFLKIALPFLILACVCVLLYQHIISPIRQLEKTTRQFASGNYKARVSGAIGPRHDELSSLAQTFDAMAERTGGLIVTQRQLIADLSHELRTPITRIEMALDALKSEPTQQGSQDRIQKDVRIMRELAEDALTLAWMDTEAPQYHAEDIDLVDLIDSILDDASFEFPDKSIDANLPDNAYLSKTSSRILGQAIENVTRNAFRYTPTDGSISISLVPGHSGWDLSISDQGPGVPESDLEKIFRPFYRVETARDRESGGFGLGLALAKRQIEGVGGHITASNIQPHGLKMSIYLPS